jgi:THO complex subunit 5
MVEDIVTDTDLRFVLDISTQTRQQCIALLDYTDISGFLSTESLSQESQREISKQQKLMLSHLAQLRGLNRNAILAVRQTKQTTAEARSEIDRLHLQLQNLYYEQRHLRGEISACESYK